MYVADIGRCSVLYSAGALRLMVFRPPRAGGQSCGGVALRHPRAVLSSLFCTQLRGAFAFFCARFARRECLEIHAGRGFQGIGLAPVSVREHRDGRMLSCGKQCRALACSGMLINQHANKCTGVHKNPCGIFIKSLGQSCFSKKQDIERRTGCVLIHMLHVN